MPGTCARWCLLSGKKNDKLTNTKEVHNQSLDNILSANSYVRKEVVADGNCYLPSVLLLLMLALRVSDQYSTTTLKKSFLLTLISNYIIIYMNVTTIFSVMEQIGSGHGIYFIRFFLCGIQRIPLGWQGILREY